MSTPQQRIREFYGFDFPEDFFRFREFMAELPQDLLSETMTMQPAFPFDVAEDFAATKHPDHPHWEDRWYHDLPEFITLFIGDHDGLHWGYYFDAPGKLPPIVPYYWHSDTFQHAVGGDSIFEAFRNRLESDEAQYTEMIEDEPEEAEDYQARLDQLAEARQILTRFGEGFEAEDVRLWGKPNYQGRLRSPIAPTWSDLGIVVPPDPFRSLSADPFDNLSADPFDNARLSGRMELKQEEVERAIAEAATLCRTGYPGTALKLGHDLWVWANAYPQVYALLDGAYAGLGRDILQERLAEARAYRAWCDGQRRR